MFLTLAMLKHDGTMLRRIIMVYKILTLTVPVQDREIINHHHRPTHLIIRTSAAIFLRAPDNPNARERSTRP